MSGGNKLHGLGLSRLEDHNLQSSLIQPSSGFIKKKMNLKDFSGNEAWTLQSNNHVILSML